MSCTALSTGECWADGLCWSVMDSSTDGKVCCLLNGASRWWWQAGVVDSLLCRLTGKCVTFTACVASQTALAECGCARGNIHRDTHGCLLRSSHICPSLSLWRSLEDRDSSSVLSALGLVDPLARQVGMAWHTGPPYIPVSLSAARRTTRINKWRLKYIWQIIALIFRMMEDILVCHASCLELGVCGIRRSDPVRCELRSVSVCGTHVPATC